MIRFTVNGQLREIDVDPEMPLLWVLRDVLALKGTKYGCGVGLCGVCAVLIDGASNHACMVPVRKVQGKTVTTIEGLAQKNDPLVSAWVAEQVPQCGYCQGGQIVCARALLDKHPQPSDARIDEAMSGVLCRCGTYPRIRRAVHTAAQGGALPPPEPALPARDGGVALNDWIRVHPDNTVTVVINHSEMGQGSLTGLAMLTAEELEIAPEHLRPEFAPADKKYRNSLFGSQFTGGSSSIRGEYDPLRRHAAQAREMLVAAAARRWGVGHADCHAFNGSVVHDASGRRFTYAELAADAASVEPPALIALKSPEAFRCIGKSRARLEIPDMVSGRTVYGIDIALPGMQVAAVWRVPAFGGKIRHFDAGETLKVPGVRDVFEIRSGIAVVADCFWNAERGREKLRVQWDAGANGAVTHESIYAELRTALQEKGKVVHDGAAARGIAKGERTVEAVYRTPYLAHATLEPMNCVADVRADSCDIWVGTQGQADSQKTAAEIAGLPRKNVRIHTQFLGGGFGRRLETDFVAEAVEISMRLGAPAQVIWTRADDLQHDFYRPAGMALVRAALDTGGLPTAWFLRFAGSELALDGVDIPYAVPALHEEHVEVKSPLPAGAWRSVGASNNAFVIESFVDELAHAAGRDPLEYRLALLKDAPRHRGVLQLAATKSGWNEPLPPGRGRGIAVCRCFGSWAAMVAEVSVAGNVIRVERVTCAIDCGIAANPDAVRAQMEGAVALGLSAALKEEVRVENGRVIQVTFEDYPLLTLAEMPPVDVHIVPGTEPPGGVGEPGIPVVAPAVANAVFSATGGRLRALPLRRA